MDKFKISGTAGSGTTPIKPRSTEFIANLMSRLDKRFTELFFLQMVGEYHVKTMFGGESIDNTSDLADAMIERGLICSDRLIRIFKNALLTAAIKRMHVSLPYTLVVDLDELTPDTLGKQGLTKEAGDLLLNHPIPKNDQTLQDLDELLLIKYAESQKVPIHQENAYAFLRKSGALEREYYDPFEDMTSYPTIRVANLCDEKFSGPLSYFNKANLNMRLTFNGKVILEAKSLADKIIEGSMNHDGMMYKLFSKAFSVVITFAKKNPRFTMTLDLAQLCPKYLDLSTNVRLNEVYDFLDNGYGKPSVKFLEDTGALQIMDNDQKNPQFLFF